MIDFLVGFLYLVFVLSSLLLVVIILLQEAKGGGLAGAFGGAGTEAFGVKAGGINKFTATVAGIFLGSAVIIAMITVSARSVVRSATPVEAPADAGLEAPIEGNGGAGTPSPPSSPPPADGASGEKAPAEKAAGDAPAGEKPAGEKPPGDTPAGEKGPEGGEKKPDEGPGEAKETA